MPVYGEITKCSSSKLVMLVCLQFVYASLSLSYLLVASALGEWGGGGGEWINL